MTIPDLTFRGESMWVEFDWLIQGSVFEIFFGRRPDFTDANGREYCIHVSYAPDDPMPFLFDRLYDEDAVCEDGLTVDELNQIQNYTAELARATQRERIRYGSSLGTEVQ